MPPKLVLEVKIHDVKMNVDITNPTVTASFSTSMGLPSASWTTPVGQCKSTDPSAGNLWLFGDAANDFGWDESGALSLVLLSGNEQLG